MTKRPPTNPCECGESNKQPGRKYCFKCENRVLKAMSQSSYLTQEPLNKEYRGSGSREDRTATKNGRMD